MDQSIDFFCGICTLKVVRYGLIGKIRLKNLYIVCII